MKLRDYLDREGLAYATFAERIGAGHARTVERYAKGQRVPDTTMMTRIVEATAEGLALLRGWVADERLASTRLVLLTQGALAAGPDQDVARLPHAPLWGLGRSAQNELPELPFTFPKVELPNVELPTAEQVIDFFKDAALAGTGLVSLTAERIADLQKQLVETLRTQVEKVRTAV